ncbi:hypothetical protein KFE98_15845 [bacterium SCSIO 12741]|nr:hypothetical protein KFE98_15845 [bacterium SCSIO 12741]
MGTLTGLKWGILCLGLLWAFMSTGQTTSNKVNPNWTSNGDWTGTAPSYTMTQSAILNHNSSITTEIQITSGNTLTINTGDTLTTSRNITLKDGGTLIVNGHIEGTSSGKEFKLEKGTFTVGSTGSINWPGKFTSDDNPVTIDMDGVMYIGNNWSNKVTWSGDGRIDVSGSNKLNNDGGTLFGCTTSGGGCCSCAACCLGTTSINALPISLLSFNVWDRGDHLLFRWTTASEWNNDYFEVEQSADGIHWTVLGQVDGSGTSNEIQNYSLSTPLVTDHSYYYRLSQYDFDGSVQYFSVVQKLAQGKENLEEVLIQQERGGIWLHFPTIPDHKPHVQFHSVLGSSILNDLELTSTSDQDYFMDTYSLNKGYYLIQISTGHTTLSYPVVINR